MKEKPKKINREGRPTGLSQEIAEKVILHVREQLSITNAARLSGVPSSTVLTWIKRGLTEAEQGESSDFAQFSLGIKKAQGEKVKEYLDTLSARVNNWQAIAWILERCCAEDFGKDSELYKQLLEDYKMLMQTLVDQNKGVTHGR